ncbi:Ktr-type potassium uptake transporter/ potassium-translocating subunit B [Synechococcus sp. A18-25c]|uniref:TrkH family potassium uptake protein n=1 Tax=Synechococcus sp. A18-25c TaxID=1866938 RepID=UPI000C456C64|nr:potassium transporter TrkG [Synechococcus sp. A18-25c]MAN18906.1 potassium transporter TrkG [Synechococcus sp. EAC657]MEC7247630.1 potassium transporter TrkG [Cyanobacteriota bacterium]MEC7896822.1 potassium transporter TrkG [Cyanobacteriota bacterium]QNJ18906.1 Ktr-type potassium uptake transporter/ potassium-translocating subunit B [Synechococcus sp. A18-25c]
MPLPKAIHRTQAWYRRLTVPQFTVVTGLLVISLGTLLLASPLCSSQSVGLWEALFTATSAVTVTGLTVIDVGKDLTTFGQAVLALMILVGGLGLMAITTFLQGFVVRGASLRRRLDRGQTLDEFGVGGVGGTFRSIALTAAVLIIIGAALLYNFGFSDIPAGGERLWASIFHSISAYNNAGFGLWSDSLVSYRTNRVVNGVIVVLIVLGGLGWRVTSDLWSNRQRLKRKNLSLHTRLVLRTSILLVLVGTLGLLLTESLSKGHVMTTMGWGERMMSALFASVSARTAGFTTLPLSVQSVSDSGLLLLMTLMFIGASPGGTGGGIKTTTVAALMAATRSTLRGQDDVVIRHRQISDKVVLRAVSITMASLMFVLVMAMLLALSTNQNVEEPLTFLELLFTCISAFATVGLDLGVTEQLGRFGQLILVVGMFVGRLGILLLLSAIWESFDRNQLQRQNRIGYPREDLYV